MTTFAEPRIEQAPPYRAYATIMGVFAGGLALAGGAARLLGRDPQDQTWLDLVTLAATQGVRGDTRRRRELPASRSSRVTLAITSTNIPFRQAASTRRWVNS